MPDMFARCHTLMLGAAMLAALSLPLAAQTASTTTSASVSDSAAIAAGTQAAEAWLALLDNGEYGTSWDQAASAFRAALGKAEWEQAVSQARGPFEPFKGRVLVGARYERNLPNAPPGEYVIIQYQTTVAEARTVVETVVPMKDTDGTWRVSGYFVRPQ